MFEIYPEDIEELQNVREFEIWLKAIDSVVCFQNIDNLIEYLLSVNKPDFVLYALQFKKEFIDEY